MRRATAAIVVLLGTVVVAQNFEERRDQPPQQCDTGIATLPPATDETTSYPGECWDSWWWDQSYNTFPFPTFDPGMWGASALCMGNADLLYRAGQDERLLFRKQGSEFVHITGSSGLPIGSSFIQPYSCAFGDIDNDGDQDLYTTYDYASDGDRLFVNVGGDQFVDATGSRGILDDPGTKTKPVFFDMDNNGDLDLLVTSNGSSQTNYVPNRLYRNNGNGTFTLVDLPNVSMGSNHRTLDVVVGDFNGDMYQDLFLINGAVSGGHNGDNRLLINNRNWTFSDTTVSMGIQPGIDCVVGVTGDFNADGSLDLACGYGSQIHYWEWNGNGFSNKTAVSNLNNIPPRHITSLAAGDINGDGKADLYVGCKEEPLVGQWPDSADLWLFNEGTAGQAYFEDRTWEAYTWCLPDCNYGFDTGTVVLRPDDSHALSIVKDGNPAGTDYSWFFYLQNTTHIPGYPANNSVVYQHPTITLKFRGDPSNRQGIGARVTVVLNRLGNGQAPTKEQCLSTSLIPGEFLRQWVKADGHSQGPPTLLFQHSGSTGLNWTGLWDCVVTEWPSGAVDVWTGLPNHTVKTIVEGENQLDITGLFPSSGSQMRSIQVAIQGTGFEPGARVWFGDIELHQPGQVNDDKNGVVLSISPTEIVVLTPEEVATGTAGVRVQNPDGEEDSHTGYTYEHDTHIEFVNPHRVMIDGESGVPEMGYLYQEILPLLQQAPSIPGLPVDGGTPAIVRMQVHRPADTNGDGLPDPATAALEWILTNVNSAEVPAIGSLKNPDGTGGTNRLLVPIHQIETATGTEYWAVGVWESPADQDVLKGNQWVTVNFGAVYSDGSGCCPSNPPQITAGQSRLYTPLIVSIHGIGGSRATYAFKEPFYVSASIQDHPAIILDEILDYSHINGAWGDPVAIMDYLMEAIQQAKVLYTRFTGIPCTRVVLRVHSMGFSLALDLTTRDDYFRFFGPNPNWGLGDIARIIGITSVTAGAEIADDVWFWWHHPDPVIKSVVRDSASPKTSVLRGHLKASQADIAGETLRPWILDSVVVSI